MLLTKQLLAFRPSKIDLIFACKTFFAAMLALYIAFLLDLSYPMWAAGTVFILASPYAGMVSSKAIYRLMGTLVGAAVAVFITPYLINTPLLFTFVLALWTSFCLYISMLDRTPRSYMLMLAGYTSVMIVCNAINNIQTTNIFDIALGRVLEISLAVIISAVVSATIFPLHIGSAIQQRIKKALQDTDASFMNMFRDQEHKSHALLISAINRDINDIHGLAVHLKYEKGALKGMTKPLQELLHQFSLVLLNIVSMSERLNQIDMLDPTLREPLTKVAEKVQEFLQRAPDLSRESVIVLPQGFDDFFAKLIAETEHPQTKVVLSSLHMDMRHFIQNVYTVNYIWALIGAGRKKLPAFIVPLTTRYPSLHRDHGVALRGGLAAFVSVIVGFSIWIYSGWQYGYMLAQMATVIACILTAIDNPIPVLKVFMRGTLYATLIVFFYLFFVLPDVKTFWQLALVLAPVLIFAVMLIPHPPLSGIGLPIAINVTMALNLQNHYQIVPAASIDAALAGLVGPIIPILALYYIRAMSPDMTAKRILAAHYQSMYQALYLPFGLKFKIHLRGMLDRIGVLNSKLVESPEIKQAMHDVLVETSALIDLTRLQEIANLRETPDVVRGQILYLQNIFERNFRLQAQQQTQLPDLDEINLLLDELKQSAYQITDENIRSRLWMSINNIRYSICHSTATLPHQLIGSAYVSPIK